MQENNFSILNSIKVAWSKVKGSKGTFWSIVAGIIVIELIDSYLRRHTNNQMPTAHFTFNPALIFIISIIMYIFRLSLSWGIIYIGILRAEDKPIQFKMIKYVFNFSTFFRMLGLILFRFIIYLPILIFIIFTLVFKAHELHLVWPNLIDKTNLLDSPIIIALKELHQITYLAFIAICLCVIYLQASLYISEATIIAEKAPLLTAIKKSFSVTKSNILKLVGLSLINMAIIVLAILPLGIGLIWAIPYLLINYGVVYKTLSLKHN